MNNVRTTATVTSRIEELLYDKDPILWPPPGTARCLPDIHTVMSWLRCEKNISIEPGACASGWYLEICKAGNVRRNDCSGGTFIKSVDGPNDGGRFDTYEEAAMAGIEYVLTKILK